MVVTLTTGGVEIDDMDSLSTGACEPVRHFKWVVRINGWVRVIAALEPNAFAAEDVDGRDDEHCLMLRQRVGFTCSW